MVELRKQEKEEKSLRREQVSRQFFNNSELVNYLINYIYKLFVFVLFVLKSSILIINNVPLNLTLLLLNYIEQQIYIIIVVQTQII